MWRKNLMRDFRYDFRVHVENKWHAFFLNMHSELLLPAILERVSIVLNAVNYSFSPVLRFPVNPEGSTNDPSYLRSTFLLYSLPIRSPLGHPSVRQSVSVKNPSSGSFDKICIIQWYSQPPRSLTRYGLHEPLFINNDFALRIWWRWLSVWLRLRGLPGTTANSDNDYQWTLCHRSFVDAKNSGASLNSLVKYSRCQF